MNRKTFIQSLALTGIAGATMKLNELYNLTAPFENTETMPVLFLGHGSPMNAIEENEFVRGFRNIGQSLPRPKAILCVSAHWETQGTFVTAMEKPRTIHDFGGFPQALFDQQYPAPGSPEFAAETKKLVHKTAVGLDESWGLDHGAWTVIKHLYPKADVPVFQLSLDYRKDPRYHYELAKELMPLREKGVLIIGSGNMVHNLGMIDWRQSDSGFSWAETANQKFKELIESGDHDALIKYHTLGREIAMSIPTPEHYLPLLYSLGLQGPKESLKFYNDKTVMGSISMTSVRIG